MKAHVIGDIGGHAELLKETLRNLGCDLTEGTIPEGHVIVQVGDLVDRGPDSDKALAVVSKFIENPAWYQLIGNHEARFLGGPQFDTPHSLSSPSKAGQSLLEHWYTKGLMKAAVGLVRGHQGTPGVIASHAGITFELWSILGELDLEGTVNAVNALPDVYKFAAGECLGNPGSLAGPCWATVWNELIAPWQTAVEVQYIDRMPFDQIHGHATLFTWGTNKKTFRGHPAYEQNAWSNRQKRHSSYAIPYDSARATSGGDVMQCDPGLGIYASHVPVPMTIDCERIIG